jgi:hypothetical protein
VTCVVSACCVIALVCVIAQMFEKEIGAGSFGTVYKGQWKSWTVAIKQASTHLHACTLCARDLCVVHTCGRDLMRLCDAHSLRTPYPRTLTSTRTLCARLS